jgi:hypothetical protein
MLESRKEQGFEIWMSISEYEQKGLKRELGFFL